MGNKPRRSLWERTKRITKYFWLKILRIKASPHTVAMGIACGVFGGFLPVIPGLPLQTIAGVALAFVLRGNKVAAAVSTWISNPFNWVFFYIAQFHVGSYIMHVDLGGKALHELEVADIAALGYKGITVMMIGGVIMGVPASIASYFIALPLIKRYRKRRALRKLKKKTSL